MTQAVQITQFACPGCGLALQPPGAERVRCPVCDWRGQAHLFAPLPLALDQAAPALPEDATCIHHPRKKATAICAGTGDYICSLCAVDLNGQVYSAAYLDAGGKQTIGKAFDRYLQRPDLQIRTYLLLLLIPYADAVAVLFAFLWIPHAFYLYSKALRMRQENELFGRLMGRGSVVLIPIVLTLVGIGWLIGAILLAMYLLARNGR